ncbi:hypothetical protein [Paraburkholderia sediminicola]|uniref:hypothetical protein n=1 Tax=Paraburkholderia sediminicola TaxID=458836 RepID=UPI0038B8E05A
MSPPPPPCFNRLAPLSPIAITPEEVFARIRSHRTWRVVELVHLLDPVAAERDRLLVVIA